MPDFSEHIVRVQRFGGNAYGVGRVADAEQDVGEHLARRKKKSPPPVAVAIRSHDEHRLNDILHVGLHVDTLALKDFLPVNRAITIRISLLELQNVSIKFLIGGQHSNQAPNLLTCAIVPVQEIDETLELRLLLRYGLPWHQLRW